MGLYKFAAEDGSTFFYEAASEEEALARFEDEYGIADLIRRGMRGGGQLGRRLRGIPAALKSKIGGLRDRGRGDPLGMRSGGRNRALGYDEEDFDDELAALFGDDYDDEFGLLDAIKGKLGRAVDRGRSDDIRHIPGVGATKKLGLLADKGISDEEILSRVKKTLEKGAAAGKGVGIHNLSEFDEYEDPWDIFEEFEDFSDFDGDEDFDDEYGIASAARRIARTGRVMGRRRLRQLIGKARRAGSSVRRRLPFEEFDDYAGMMRSRRGMGYDEGDFDDEYDDEFGVASSARHLVRAARSLGRRGFRSVVRRARSGGSRVRRGASNLRRRMPFEEFEGQMDLQEQVASLSHDRLVSNYMEEANKLTTIPGTSREIAERLAYYHEQNPGFASDHLRILQEYNFSNQENGVSSILLSARKSDGEMNFEEAIEAYQAVNPKLTYTESYEAIRSQFPDMAKEYHKAKSTGTEA